MIKQIQKPNKKDIRDLTIEELQDYCAAKGERPYRAGQIFDWLYVKGVSSISGMTSLSAGFRENLSQDFHIQNPVIVKHLKSVDGTQKFLLKLSDQEHIETVLIPAKGRATVCVSTQAGCKFGCRFCASGIGGWKRNLSPSEILTQVIIAKNAAEDQPLSHVVFMGTGEPLDNYDNVIKAVRILNSPKAFKIAARRITISTCGVIPKILKLAEEGKQLELAVSLHGYDDESRKILMPVNKKYPMKELMEACRTYGKSTKRQITFEYIMIKDVTCTDEAALRLKKLFRGILCKMNLIPYNPVSEFDHQPPGRQEIRQFRERLREFGVHATVRVSRGQDVAAACGQLRHSAGK